MAFRAGGLTSLDPLSVPLPSGTEVTTRVDRLLGERRIPQGAIGRVLGRDGDLVRVNVVGVGEVAYLREELVPRKIGQALFATRREAAWEALRRCVVLEATVGSHAWGLASAQSDVDRRGAFALPFAWTIGLVPPPEDLISEDASTNYWEVKKLVRQALRADPNTLELLFLPTIQPLDPIGEWILEARDAFASRDIYGSFGRYALSQLKKLAQSQRLAQHRAIVLEWLREDPGLTLDEVARKLAIDSLGGLPTLRDATERAKEYIKQLYGSLHDQGLLRGSDFAALIELAETRGRDFELPRELRPKNAYNLLRLIRSAIDWLATGSPTFEVRGEFREELLRIKRGEVPLEDVIRAAEALTPELERARQSEALPAKPDLARADAVVRRIGEELARRHVERVEGPFGRDAPEYLLATREAKETIES